MVTWRKNKKEKKEKKDELEVKLRKGIWKTGKSAKRSSTSSRQ